jgi:Polyketide cyclase / dehydrase and lipid transport
MSIVKRIVLTFVFLAVFFNVGLVSASENQSEEVSEAEKKAHVSLKLTAVVKAPPELVWKSIHDARTKYPGLQSAKVISEDERGSVFEQQFLVPFLGESTSKFSLADTPPGRVDYKLLESNVFSVMDGTWTLTPEPDGRSTKLAVTCRIATKGIFPKLILKVMLGKKLTKQLAFVKTTAERKEAEELGAEKKP